MPPRRCRAYEKENVKSFSLHSVSNLQALQPSLIELRGHRIALPAVSSHEPLLRGCNQREWLERLVALGIRHLVVPLNGSEEDACLYARRHPSPAEAQPASGRSRDVIYDLNHRDEGVFARLQFLLRAADSIGVLVGLSLFNVSALSATPFQKEANEQKVSFDVLNKMALGSGTLRRKTSLLKKQAARREDLERSLISAVDWIGAEVRGRQGVWVELFRNLSGPQPEPAAPLKQLESQLIRRMAAALSRAGESDKKSRTGPWFVVPEEFDWSGTDRAHAAPFRIRTGSAPERELDSVATLRCAAFSERQPVLCRMLSGRKSAGPRRAPQRASLWRAVMQGCWPIIAIGFSRQDYQRPWKDMAQLATFCRQWAGSGYLRPCPEMLARVAPRARGRIFAATDGAGRYFIYLHRCAVSELELSALPGTYRFYWFDPASGRGLDHGDGIDGGAHCFVPGPAHLSEALLILEEDELPEPLAVW